MSGGAVAHPDIRVQTPEDHVGEGLGLDLVARMDLHGLLVRGRPRVPVGPGLPGCCAEVSAEQGPSSWASVAYRSSRGRFRSISISNNVEYVSGGSPGLLPGCLTELPDPLRYVRPQEEAPWSTRVSRMPRAARFVSVWCRTARTSFSPAPEDTDTRSGDRLHRRHAPVPGERPRLRRGRTAHRISPVPSLEPPAGPAPRKGSGQAGYSPPVG